jgi:hypothetical protein
MVILSRLLKLLNFLEQVVAFTEFLETPTALPVLACLLSYQGLLLIHCDAASAAVLASTATLTLHCVINCPHS